MGCPWARILCHKICLKKILPIPSANRLLCQPSAASPPPPRTPPRGQPRGRALPAHPEMFRYRSLLPRPHAWGTHGRIVGNNLTLGIPSFPHCTWCRPCCWPAAPRLHRGLKERPLNTAQSFTSIPPHDCLWFNKLHQSDWVEFSRSQHPDPRPPYRPTRSGCCCQQRSIVHLS